MTNALVGEIPTPQNWYMTS